MRAAAGKGQAILWICLLVSCQARTWAGADVPIQRGLVLWLDAADADGGRASANQSVSDSKLGKWTDRSGHDNHVEQRDPSRQPTVVDDQIGGKRVLQFDGDDVLTREVFTGFAVRDQPIHAIFVMKAPERGARDEPRLIEFQPVGGDLSQPATVKQHGFWIGQGGDGRTRIGTHYGDEGSALSVAWDSQPHVVEVIYAGAQHWVHYLDGIRDGAGLLRDRDFRGFNAQLRLAIGQHYGADDRETSFHGSLAEVLIYNRVLTAQEQNEVKSYLGKKWSLNLSVQPVPHFERDVFPILKQHCHDCHGGEVRESNLDLRTVTAMIEGGESGPVLSRGHPENSDLLDQIVEGAMPPDDAPPLDSNQVAVIRRWIAAGAPADEPVQPLSTDHFVSEKDRQFWAYQKIARPEVPHVTDSDRVRTPVDAFVLARLESQGLSLAPDSPPATLIRRVYFDLTGLPPSPNAVRDFLADPSDLAYERLVDRLLSSEHFGERWGRSWLDWAGYVDVFGRDNDFSIIKPLEGRWRYRDYVIRAFNQDKPLDRFLLEQLAGDELVDWRHAEHFTPEIVELLTATGFLLCSDDDTDQDELNTPDIRHHVLQQTGEIVANNLFALTVQCAKCHHHKYEAISQVDYYRWLANFSPIFNPQRWVTSTEHQLAIVSQMEKASTKPDADIVQAAVEQSPPSPTYLLRRGDVNQPGVEVQPGLFSILAEPLAADRLHYQPQGATSGRRLAIAEQITNPNSIAGGLVIRVFVNRVWQELFGKGIVATSDNFGVSGARPTHPQLLDWLAAKLVENKLHIKPLIKMMVSSTAYRQASIRNDAATAKQVDPSNSLLWKARLRRLSSEYVRDRVLAVSGELDRTVGGPPIPLLAEPHGKIVVDMESLPTPTSHLRRSLYILNRRNYHLSLLTTFDQPFLTTNCTARKPSAVVTQALTMMNDAFILEQADAFAERVAEPLPAGPAEAWIARAFHIALCRDPNDVETKICLGLFERHAQQYQEADLPADVIARKTLVQLCHLLLNTNEFLYIE